MRVAAILLAAGRGARFDASRSKLLADLGGRPLLRRVAEAALASRAGKTIVVTGCAREEIESALSGLPIAVAHNPDFADGLASSLRVGLSAAKSADAALVLLGDMPGASATVIDALIAAFEQAPGCAAVVPLCQGRRGNPVLLARAIFSRVEALEGDEGARRLLQAMKGVVEVPVDDEGVLLDIDTPADLELFRRSRCWRP